METYSSSNAVVQYPEERANSPGYAANHILKMIEYSDILQGFGKRKLHQYEKKKL